MLAGGRRGDSGGRRLVTLEHRWQVRGSGPLLGVRGSGHRPQLPPGCRGPWIPAGGI